MASLQPSQLYINRSKLKAITKLHSLPPVRSMHSSSLDFTLSSIPPILIIFLDKEWIYVDGHTRAYYLYSLGYPEAPTYIYTKKDIDLSAYSTCVGWCKEEKITTISDLSERIIDNEEYQKLWINRYKSL